MDSFCLSPKQWETVIRCSRLTLKAPHSTMLMLGFICLFRTPSLSSPWDEFMYCELQTCSLETEWRHRIKATVYSKIQNLQRKGNHKGKCCFLFGLEMEVGGQLGRFPCRNSLGGMSSQFQAVAEASWKTRGLELPGLFGALLRGS